MKQISFGVATVGIMLCGLLAIPIRAVAQGADGSQTAGLEKQKVSLDLESSNLYYGLKLLFSQVKCNFTIDESLKGLTVTAHFTDVPFRIALESLLKSTSTPLTYKIENNIYSVSTKLEEPPAKEESGISVPVNKGSDVAKIDLVRIHNISDLDIVQAFGGTILNIGLFGQGGNSAAQNQRGRQNNGGFFEGGENMYGTGHGSVIVVTPPAGTKQ